MKTPVDAAIGKALKAMGMEPMQAMHMARQAVLNEQIQLGAADAFVARCETQGMSRADIEATWRFAMSCARDR